MIHPISFPDTPTGGVRLSLDDLSETIWATQAQLAALFGRDVRAISEHIEKIFADGELERNSVIRKFRITTEDGKSYSTLHYSLDVILSVGYRISSAQATKFRRWATTVLKDYVLKGFAIDEARVASDPAALKGLAAKVRKLRSGEKQIYEAVRDAFKLMSSDYDPNSTISQNFYAQLQNKFLFATVGQTSADIILRRADHRQIDMGLTSKSSAVPRLSDAKVAKNYLSADELYQLHVLCEQFLLFAESKALRAQPISMSEMSAKFDELIALQGQPVLAQYKGALRKRAVAHAKAELEKYRQKTRIAKTAGKVLARQARRQ